MDYDTFPHVIRTEIFIQDGVQQLAILISRDHPLASHLKQLEGIRWQDQRACWHIPYDQLHIGRLLRHVKPNSFNRLSAASPNCTPFLSVLGFARFTVRVSTIPVLNPATAQA